MPPTPSMHLHLRPLGRPPWTPVDQEESMHPTNHWRHPIPSASSPPNWHKPDEWRHSSHKCVAKLQYLMTIWTENGRTLLFFDNTAQEYRHHLYVSGKSQTLGLRSTLTTAHIPQKIMSQKVRKEKDRPVLGETCSYRSVPKCLRMTCSN